MRHLALLCGVATLASCGYETVNLSTQTTADYTVIPISEAVKSPPLHYSTASTEEMPTAKRSQEYTYLIGPSDRIQIILYIVNPEGNGGLMRIIPQDAPISSETEYIVDDTGYIRVPFAGRIKAAGKSVNALHQELHNALSNYFVEPQLKVGVSTFSSSRAVITGEVGQQKELILTDKPMTVMEALSSAGGYSQAADLSQVRLTRVDGETETIDLRSSLLGGEPVYNPVLQTGDTLHIPRNHGNEVFMLGEVVNNQILQLNNRDMTLTSALSAARGINPITAQPSEIYVIRELHDETWVFHLDASSPSAYIEGDNFLLQPRDVIYVGARPITDWSRYINQLIPSSISQLVNRNNYEGN